MNKITRDEWIAKRAAENHRTVAQLLEYLDRRSFVIVECDGSCGYDSCEGWIAQLDFAALLLAGQEWPLH